MNKKSKIAIILSLVMIVALTAPVSAFYFSQNTLDKRAEKIVIITDQAAERVEILINSINDNQTALDIIEAAGNLEQLNGNISLYEIEGLESLTAAHDALNLEDYQGAIDNAKEALSIFRQVYKSINIIINESGLHKRDLVGDQILLEAIERALERIQRLRETLPENATALHELLDQAEDLLNLDNATELISEDKANEVIEDLREANKLISQVYKGLRNIAKELYTLRIKGYLANMHRHMEKFMEKFKIAKQEGVDLEGFMSSFNFQNETQFKNNFQNKILNALGKLGEFQNVLRDLEDMGRNFGQMNQALNQYIMQHQAQHGWRNGGNNQNNGN